jgi:hypothetical protein
MSKEAQLESLIDIVLPRLARCDQNGHWTGTAAELKVELCRSSYVGHDAEKLLNWNNATGTLLGLLQKRDPEKYQSGRVGHDRDRVWIIRLPADT